MDESLARLTVFFSLLVLIGIWEVAAPRRKRTQSVLVRWANNFGLVVLNTTILRLIFPTALVGVAAYCEGLGWGMLNVLSWPLWIEILFTLVVLDLAIYCQHVVFHHVPVLWRVHRMHHTDVDFDLSTGVRFHPIEIMLSMGIKILIVVLLGAAPLAVILFEILLNGSSLFSHGNIKVPRLIDSFLRLLLVTPDMHRVHHSVDKIETDSNFGFCLSWWDRLFGTYRDQPALTHRGMTLGLIGYRSKRWQNFWGLLRLPFAKSGEF